MSISANKEQLQLQIISYLYGDLPAEDVARFERELETNPALKDAFEEEQRLNSALPIGMQPQIDEDRLQGNRFMLRQNLQRENRTRFSLKHWLQDLFSRPLVVAFQGGAMAATFVLGILLASPSAVQTSDSGVGQLLAADTRAGLTPLQMVSDEDYEIYQLKVNNYDVVTGEIDLSFSLASETRLTGNVADQNIYGLMAVALQGDIDSASRLDTINALQPVASGDKVYEALIHVLTHDQNPGVRYQAVQSLAQLAHQESVRDALRYALSEDVNQGVRIEAFQALVNYPDEQTLAVFRQQMNTDSNEFIRAQARTIVEASDSGSITL